MTSNPIISEVQTYESGELSFNIKNVDVSIVNGLRRACQSNVTSLVFKGFPHNESNINIVKNTTKFHNEYIKHRLQCVPIYETNTEVYENYRELYKIRLRAKNTTLNKMYITTNNFEFIEKETNEPHPNSSEKINKLFRPDPISGDGILILVLMPHYNKSEKPDEIDMEIEFDIGTSSENSCWNIVCKSVYENIQDVDKVNAAIQKLQEDENKSDMEIRDFQILDAQRLYKNREFKFTIQSIGVHENQKIVDMACKYIIDSMNELIQEMNNITSITKQDDIEQIQNTNTFNLYIHDEMDEFIVLKVGRDDYTLGKLIENHLYSIFRDDLEFVGFEKEHATKKEAYIYIKYMNNDDSKSFVRNHIKTVAENIIETYKSIQTEIYKN